MQLYSLPTPAFKEGAERQTGLVGSLEPPLLVPDWSFQVQVLGGGLLRLRHRHLLAQEAASLICLKWRPP